MVLPKNAKKIPGNGCMDDLLFYVLFNSISVTDCEGNNDGTLFTVGKIPPPGGIKPGMENLPFHVLSNSILIIPPSPFRGGIKPGMDNLPFHLLLNSISIISG